MAGLSRRQFLARTGALAAATGIPVFVLGTMVASAPAGAVDVPSTPSQTILQGTQGTRSYRTLVAGPGERHLARLDVLGSNRPPAARRPVGPCCTSPTSRTCTSSTRSRRGGSSR